MLKKNIIQKWRNIYSVIIPFIIVIIILLIDKCTEFDLTDICRNGNFNDMLQSLITFLSIVIGIFGFLIPALVSVKNDQLVQYFLDKADVDNFVNQIKLLIFTGLLSILLSVILFMFQNINAVVLIIFMYVWIGMIALFICSSYRFISIILKLLCGTKNDERKECKNAMNDDEVKKLNDKLPKI